ncbi:MAG: hypothetical protein KJ621_11765 [Proteobacteria bacterium]|nr:hypothetical protein [Pseudomonadota bacterium]
MKIEEVFRKLKPIAGMDLDRLWREYILADAAGKKAIEDSMRLSLARRLSETYEEREVLLEPPAEAKVKGEYPLGVVHYGRQKFYQFGLREREWVQHVGIFSRSGWGKTNVGFLILLNLLSSGKPFLVFDWKRNYRDLLALLPEKEILVFTAGRPISQFSFNPLIPPPGTPPRAWLKKLIAIAQHSLFLGEGVAFLLQEAIDSVYRQAGVYSGQEKEWPTLQDVKTWLESRKVKGRAAQWMDSAMRAVGVLCYGEMGSILNRREPLPIQELLEKNVILELDGLCNTDKTFLIEALLLWIHHYRMGQPDREVFKHAILIEEAHHILLRKKQEMSGEEAVTDIILREIRELGESVILLDQHPSLISKPALGNTYTTIVGNLKHRSDISMIADSLLLDTKRARYLGKLEIGWAMVKLQGRWFEPFLVRFPLVRIKKGVVTDGDVVAAMRGFWASRPDEEPVEKKVEAEDQPEKESVDDIKEDVPENARLLLVDVGQHPASAVTERYERVSLNNYQGNRAKDWLVGQGYLASSSVSTGKARIRHLRLTSKGRKALEALGEEVQARRAGGPEHEFRKKKLAEDYRSKGWEVVKEYPIGGGKTVDLACFKDGRKVAVEIETGKSCVGSNVKKCLENGFDEVRCIKVNSAPRSKE